MTSRHRDKPPIRGFTPAMAAPEWAWFWEACVFALPLWEGAGEAAREYAYDIEGTMVAEEGGGDVTGLINWQRGDDGTLEVHIDENTIDNSAPGIRFGDHPSKQALDDQISIIAGVVPDTNPDATGGGRLISHGFSSSGDNWTLMFDGGEAPRGLLLRINNNDLYSLGNVTPGLEYVQVAGTYRPNDPRLWVDGKEITNTDTTIRNDPFDQPIGSGTHPVMVGRNAATSSSRYYLGSIRYVYVLNVALSEGQAAQLRDDPYGPFRSRVLFVPEEDGVVEHNASGAVQADDSTATGQATRTVTSSGTVQADDSTATGQATRTVTSSGTVQADDSTATGQATRTVTSSGTVQADDSTATGQATRTVTSSGTVQADDSTATGVAAGGANVTASVVATSFASGQVSKTISSAASVVGVSLVTSNAVVNTPISSTVTGVAIVTGNAEIVSDDITASVTARALTQGALSPTKKVSGSALSLATVEAVLTSSTQVSSQVVAIATASASLHLFIFFPAPVQRQAFVEAENRVMFEERRSRLMEVVSSR